MLISFCKTRISQTGQRRSVVESIDGAKTLREVKLLYKKSYRIRFSGSGSSRLSESRTRRLFSDHPLDATAEVLLGSATAEVDRWAVLAGLKE